MKIRADLTPVAGVYKATISLDGVRPLSGRETDAVSALGEPTVNFGGDFESVDAEFTLPANDLSIPSGLPYTEEFDTADYADAAARGRLWISTVMTRIADSMATLIGTDISAAGSTVETLGTTPAATVPDSAAVRSWMEI